MEDTASQQSNGSMATTSNLSSIESSSQRGPARRLRFEKPAGSNADSGTYTCTYRGCTLRFETPAKLQKHKREGHRQSAPLVGGSTTTKTQSQDGPHICTQISPQTNKPCNAVFSRPYDLTRHEGTTHNTLKLKRGVKYAKKKRHSADKTPLLGI